MTIEEQNKFLIRAGRYIAGVIVAAAILLFVIGSLSSESPDELERKTLTAEGNAIVADMERANRDHDWSQVNEIRARDASFKRRSADYLIRHGRTPPPER